MAGRQSFLPQWFWVKEQSKMYLYGGVIDVMDFEVELFIRNVKL